MTLEDGELLETLFQAAHKFLMAELHLSGPPSTSIVPDVASRNYWRARGELIDAHDAIANARIRRAQGEADE